MDPHITRVIPYMLRLDLQREVVSGVFPVFFCVSAFVPPTTYVAANEADPEIIGAVADTAE